MLNEEIITKLEQAIDNQFDQLDTCATGSEEQKTVVDNIVKLSKLHADEAKICMDQEESDAKLELDKDQAKADAKLKWKQFIKDCVHSGVKLVIEASAVVLPLTLYRYYLDKAFVFEETGTITSPTSKNLINKIRPTR